MDLVDFFRGRYSWRKLETLIQYLPTGSAYWAARADDDEAVKAFVEQDDGQERSRGGAPDLRDMSLTNQLLIELVDGISAITARLEVANGAKSAKVVPFPRPHTAWDRVEEQLESEQVNDLVGEVEAAMERWGSS